MIRINLLGTPKAKARHLPKVTMSAPSLRMLSILAIVIAFGAVYFMYWRAQNQHEKTQVELRDADKQLAALAGVKAAYTQKQKEVDALKQKFSVIDQLRANQNGPVQLLNTITQTVNSTDAVWLSKMSDDGKVDFRGWNGAEHDGRGQPYQQSQEVRLFQERRTEGNVAGRYGERLPGVHLHAGV